MQILAICGSLQSRSANLALLKAVEETAGKERAQVVIFDGIRNLPYFDIDLDAGEPSPVVAAWRRSIVESDAVLIASPEYGHSLPGALKNAIDWVIGSGELHEKIVAITASVPSPERGRLGLQALHDTLNAINASVVWEEPITRGPDEAHDISALVAALVGAVTQSHKA